MYHYISNLYQIEMIMISLSSFEITCKVFPRHYGNYQVGREKEHGHCGQICRTAPSSGVEDPEIPSPSFQATFLRSEHCDLHEEAAAGPSWEHPGYYWICGRSCGPPGRNVHWYCSYQDFSAVQSYPLVHCSGIAENCPYAAYGGRVTFE